MKDEGIEQHPPFVVSVPGSLETTNVARLDVRQVHADHADFVFRTLQRMGVADRHLDDALQDTFLVVHRRLDSFDGSSAITTWLFGICIKVAAAHRRRASGRHEHTVAEVPDAAPDGTQPTPEDAAATREAQGHLVQLLDALDAEKRAVFVMFEIESMSCTQIASLSGVPVGTVYSRLSAAREQFEEALDRWRLRTSRQHTNRGHTR